MYGGVELDSRINRQWQSMLIDIAAHNAPAEISRGNSSDINAAVTYRSRVFEVLDDGCIIVGTPRQAVIDRSFGNRDDVELLIMHNNERLVATCTIRETFVYQVNDSLRLTCYRLSPGRRPKREQRRSFFRVGVAAMELKPVKLIHENEEARFEFQGRLVNISGGGLGISVRASRQILNQIKRKRSYQCAAWLGEEEHVNAPVRIVHIEALGEDGLYLGVEFDIDDPSQLQFIEQKMQHRCTEVQRLQLQRRRA